MDVTNASGTNSTLSNAQAQSLPGNLSDSVTSALGGNSPSASTVAPTNPDGSPVQQATPATPSSTLPAAGTSGGVGDILGDIYNSLGGASGLLNLGAFGATAAYGIDQAKKAQDDTTAKANELKQIGQPLLDESKTLLDQFKSGTLRPEQQQLVDFTTQQGQNLIDSGQALSAIAQQAYQDYQSGKLPQADEQKLNDQVAAQKQAVRQRLGSAGITDSTILAAQDQQIDNQAMQTRQSLLDARFATGNQAYDEWLKSTEAGQALKAQGYQFASTAFEQMLNDSLSFSTAGMEPISQAISLEIQSDKDLADSVNQLLGNLAAAYAYTVGGGGSNSAVNGLLGGVKDLIGKITGSGSTPSAGGSGTSGAGAGAAAGAGPVAGGVGSVPAAGTVTAPGVTAGGGSPTAPGVTPSGTGAPAAIDPNVANLGNVSASDMFGSSAANALGQTAAGPINIGSTDLSTLTNSDMFGSSASSALGSAGPSGIDIGSADLSAINPGQMFGTSATGALANVGSAASAAGAAGDAALSSVPGITAGDTFASMSPQAAASIDAAGGNSAALSSASSYLGTAAGIIGGIMSLTTKEGKFQGTASAALAGYQLGGPWGALVGAILGYAQEGGVKDAQPFKAAGLTGITMDQAWQDQNIARLASNPAASIASKLGIGSNTVAGKILDPAALFGGHSGSHWRNWDAFNKANPGIKVTDDGNYALPDGTKVTQKQLDDLAGTWYGMTYHPDGDQAGWQQKFTDVMQSIYAPQLQAAGVTGGTQQAVQTTERAGGGAAAVRGARAA